MAPPQPKAAAKPAAAPAGGVKKAKVGKPRNYDLGNGVVRFSKSKMYHKKALYKFVGKKNPKAEKPKKPSVVVKQVGGDKNGGSRTVLLKRRRSFYPTQDKIRSRPHHKSFSKHVRRTRPNLTPGTVCILLAGRHAGKRVVLVGVLPSGLLLVTGPFALNSCPLRRIPQRYVIGTSTKLELGAFKLPEHLDDAYFKKNKKSAKRSVKRKQGEDIFATKKEKYVPSEQRKKDQKLVDDAVVKAISARADRKALRGYLKSAFGLRSSQFPHRMNF
ncbi:60S ribosomal protein L6 [Leguminivora glycinivorella]|uniref:60S ribosomal protein L6 n=1 Tax=Leguminivora glycinivorella TaxID=1035111 RepID=UPI00200DAE1B|nr:60S ribosomal protein L6 [Leguminivora glycinivorella]